MKLHHHKLGKGPPLVLLHGLFGSHENLLPFARSAAGHFEVFAVDLRNHGSSPHHDEFNYEVMAEDLRIFLDRHQLPSTNLLGHSMGGKVAMLFALGHPSLVNKLVVVDIATHAYPPHHVDMLTALLQLSPARIRSRTEAEQQLADTIPDLAVRRFLLKNLKNNSEGGFAWKINLQAINRNYHRLISAISAGHTFDRPTLFLRGDRSDYITESSGPCITELFPNAVLKTIPDAGHWVHADAPVEFNRSVLDFLLN